MSFDWDGSKYATISDLQAGIGHTLIDALSFRSHEKILDIGCGIGNLTLEIAARCSQGEVLGIDTAPSMIDQAQARCSDLSNINFRVMAAEQLSFWQEFDVIFSNSALHWIPQNDRVVAAMSAALKPGGRIGLQFPLLNERHPLIAYTRRVIESLDLETCYRRWQFPWFVPTPEEYTALLQTAGFQDANVKLIHTTFHFEAVQRAYDFFDAVGLNLFLVPLRDVHKAQFRQKLRQDLERTATGAGIRFNFERIFALGYLSASSA